MKTRGNESATLKSSSQSWGLSLIDDSLVEDAGLIGVYALDSVNTKFLKQEGWMTRIKLIARRFFFSKNKRRKLKRQNI